MAFLTKDQILTAKNLTTEEVKVPEWGGSVRVRALTGKDGDRLAAYLETPKDQMHLNAFIAHLAIVDEEGNRLFSVEEVEALGELSAAALVRVKEAFERVNTLTSEDVDELTKKSKRTRG